ncbi:MAG: diaminopimelate epimerase [Methylovirgula sp.]|jgi:diaminopimelate epimerase
MHPLAGRKVSKMNGLGNEIVILDLRGAPYAVSAADVRAIDRDPHLSFDQLMVLEDPRHAGTEAFIRIFNTDGSEAGACGNGTRCVAWSLMRNTPRETISLETVSGILQCWRRGEWRFAVDMGRPRFAWNDIPLREAVADTGAIPFSFTKGAPLIASAVNMGNPHAVFFVDDLRAYDLAAIGPVLEHDPLFPERANISFAQIVAPDRIVAQVWERGAGLTLACGSAACAILVAAARKGLTGRSATVSLPGGDLMLTWGADDHVVMEGPVEWEFESTLDAALFSGVAA